MKLILVRHGAAEHTAQGRYAGRYSDTRLTEDGEREATVLGEALRPMSADAIFSGPLTRHRRTAELLAESAGIGVRKVVDALNELDFGSWEGLSKDEIKIRWPDATRAWEERSEWPKEHFVGSEAEVHGRVDAWLEIARERFADGTVVAVTSNGLLRVLGRRYLGPDRGPFGVWTGRACVVEFGTGSPNVKCWNAPPQDIA